MADDVSARVARLSEDRRALLELLRQRRGLDQPAGAVVASPIAAAGPAPAGERLPLSVGQEQLWFLAELAPGQPTYNVVQASRLTGPLDRAALGRALDRVVARHDALRVTFGEQDGAAYQVVHPPAGASLAYDDLTGQPAQRAVALLQEREVHRPFDLRTGPLFRARLVRLGDEVHVLCLVMHHIIGDGWSMSLVVGDLAELYRAECAGVAADLARPGLQYGDFVRWQREQLDGPVMAGHLAYWRECLAGLPTLDLPTDRPRPPVASFRGATVEYVFGPDLRPAVDAFARGHGASRFAVLVAAYNAMLARYAATDDVAAGTVLSGRSRPELESVVGYFANVSVLRLDLSGDPTFETLVQRARDACLGALEHQDAPFEKVVELLAPPRDPSRNPLFQVGCQELDNSNWGGPRLPGLRAEPVDLRLQRARFDLIASFVDDGERYSSLTEYSTDLFDETRILRMLGHLERLLRHGTAEPQTRLSALALLSEQEREQVLVGWQGPARQRVREPVHVQISALAREHPDLVAAKLGDAELTYGELDRRAGVLARRLRQLGVGRDSVVALLLDRDFDVLVGMLAVHKAGGGFVVMDPGHPTRRLEFIIGDTGTPAVVTKSTLLDRLPSPDGWTPVCVDTEWSEMERATAGQPLPELADEHSLAWVLYTSGSTGKPKGVMVEHHALNTFLLWLCNVFNFRPGDRLLLHMALIFDFSEGEIFAGLTRGATIVLVPEEHRSDPDVLGELIARERITYVGGPPAILGRIPPAPYPDLRYVLSGGEAISGDVVSRWNRPGRVFINGYGPTEATVGCTMIDVTGWTASSPPPIGRAMPNRLAYVLDRWDNPQPIGVPGEIMVGGDGLARGYLNRPDLTEEKFVPNPFRPGERMYRTGDLGMWTEDGQIQFLGRIDTQVKLNGLRIELEEIESTLVAHPAVAEAAVALLDDEAGGKRLVGYLVPAGAEQPSAEELRAHLLEDLPPYMVPHAFVTLEALPLTSVGKVDRAALPAPDAAGAAEVFIPPRTPAEEQVAEIFAAVFGAERVGAGDSFFDLGGNSLQAAGVLARLARATGVSVPLSAFYADPSVAAVARLVSASGVVQSRRSPLVSIKDSGRRPMLYCPHAVSGSPYWYLPLSRALGADQPMGAFEAPGLEGDEAPVEDLAVLAARYVAALRERQPSPPYLLAGWSMGGFLAFEMARQLAAAGARPGLVVMIDSNAPGPLPAPSELEIMQTFVYDLAGAAGRAPVQLDAGVGGLDAAGRLAVLREVVVGAELMPADVTAQFVASRFAVFRANVLAIYSYRPQLYPGRVVMFQAAQEESRAAWRAFAGGGYEEVVLAGTHYSMWSPENLPRLAEALQAQIVAALAEDTMAVTGTGEES